MKFLICPATDDQLEFTEDFNLFEGKDGTFYNYEVEFETDLVRITDTIGRMIPVGVEELGSLIFILNRINNYVLSKESLNEFLYQKLTQGAS